MQCPKVNVIFLKMASLIAIFKLYDTVCRSTVVIWHERWMFTKYFANVLPLVSDAFRVASYHLLKCSDDRGKLSNIFKIFLKIFQIFRIFSKYWGYFPNIRNIFQIFRIFSKYFRIFSKWFPNIQNIFQIFQNIF